MGVCTILSPIPHQGHLQPLPHILSQPQMQDSAYPPELDGLNILCLYIAALRHSFQLQERSFIVCNSSPSLRMILFLFYLEFLGVGKVCRFWCFIFGWLEIDSVSKHHK